MRTRSVIMGSYSYPSLPNELQKSIDGGGTWNPAGTGLPTRSDGPQTTPGNLGTVVVDPKTPNNLYLTIDQVLYKSTNGGGQWQLSNTGLNGKNLHDPVIDPLNPSNIYVVDRTTGGLQAIHQGVLYKTVNGGGQWSAVNLGMSTAGAYVVAVDPSAPTTLYVGTPKHGVLKSTNSGTAWTTRNTGLKALIQYMVLDPANRNTLYAGIPGLGVFQSTDGGSNWSPRNTGLGSQLVAALAISPVGSRTLWASVNSAVEQDLGVVADYEGNTERSKLSFPGVYKSTNGGVTWTLTTSPADNFGLLAPSKLVADPVDPNGIYAVGANVIYDVGATAIYHSTDAGGTWSSSNTGLPANSIYSSLVIDPKNPTTLYLGGLSYSSPDPSGGVQGIPGGPLIYKSTNSGLSWSPSGTGLPNAQGIYDLAIDPQTPSNLFASATYGGVFKSVDSGGSWQDTTSGIGSLITSYAGTQYANITYAGTPCPSPFLITASNLAIDANTPSTLFAIVNGLVLRTTDSAGTWNVAHSGLPFSPYQIAISPADSTVAYAADQGVYVYTGSGGGAGGGGTPTLSVTSPNGGESWTAGSVHNIIWTTTGTVANVKIEVSTDGGSNYTTIAASTAHTGSYSWTVPNTLGSAYRVRISDAAGTASDISNGDFTIAATGACSYAISPSSRSFGLSGGTGSVIVTAGSGCAWTATSNAGFLTITSGASGSGNGTVNHSVGTSSSSRTGTLTIAGQTFTVTQALSTGISADLFVPVALSTSGVGGSFYTTELTFTNRGTTTASVDLNYVATTGGGSGSASIAIPPGQSVFSNAIDYLRTQGLSIPDSGPRVGTLRARLSNLGTASAAGITARTTTLVRDGGGNAIGRAGLAYAAIASGAAQAISQVKEAKVNLAGGGLGDLVNLGNAALSTASYICGLRQNGDDRSNVGFQNVGDAGDGNITLRVTVYNGDNAIFSSTVRDPIVLGPGEFFQIGSVLASNGLSITNGYVKVERTSGTAPYYAYGVVNDQVNSDGSFVIPQPASTTPVTGLTLPVIVQTTAFRSELVITNFSSQARSLNFSFVADSITTADKTARFTINLPAGQQGIIPDIFTYMRDNSVAGIGPAGTTIAGALFATAAGGDISGVVLGARTSAAGGTAGGRFGLFYTAVPYGQASTSSAWVFGLQQNSENRTNLAIVNTGETDANSNTFLIDLYDGATGSKVKTLGPITLPARGWTQIGTILNDAPGVQQGYAQVRRTAGANPFITYAVINDGAGPGERTGDGAYIGSSE